MDGRRWRWRTKLNWSTYLEPVGGPRQPELPPDDAEILVPAIVYDSLVEITRNLVHQVDPQVTGPMKEKAVSPDRRKHWIEEARRAVTP